MLALLRGTGENPGTLVLRDVGGDAKQRMGQAGVTRIGWQVTSSADLDTAEERLTGYGTQYQRVDESDGGRIVTHDPDGLSIILFLAAEQSLAGKPPPFIYWYH
jgi:hypothetical protein